METKTVVLYPSPGIGHLIAMVEFGKLLLTHNSSLSITILIPAFPFNTGSYSSYMSSVSSSFPCISFHSLPSVPLRLENDPSNYANMEQIIFETHSNVNPHVTEFLQSISISSRVSAFIIDFFCYTSLNVAQSLGIPTYFFITSGAACLALFLNLPAVDKITSEKLRNLGMSLELSGLTFSVPANFLMDSMLDRGVSYYEFVKMGAHLPKSNGIIINTFESLEPIAIKALEDGICLPETPIPPIYCTGPLIADREGRRSEKAGERNECLKWLDSQPSRSVVYLGFGSRGFFSREQIREIAIGLERSGVRFLWAVRAPPNEDKAKQFLPPPEPNLDLLLPTGFLKRTQDRGLVVKLWAPQVEVLAHRSVVAFVTHCGWNSTLEAVVAGMPMVAWPLYAEQRFNKMLLVEEIGIAVPMDESEGSDEIERRVKQIVNSKEGDVIRD